MNRFKVKEITRDEELLSEFNNISEHYKVTCVTFCLTILFINIINNDSKKCETKNYDLKEINDNNIIKYLTDLIKNNLKTIKKLNIITKENLSSDFREFYQNLHNNDDNIVTYFRCNNEIYKKNNNELPSSRAIVVSSTPQKVIPKPLKSKLSI